jgi:hypothetical protein
MVDLAAVLALQHPDRGVLDGLVREAPEHRGMVGKWVIDV